MPPKKASTGQNAEKQQQQHGDATNKQEKKQKHNSSHLATMVSKDVKDPRSFVPGLNKNILTWFANQGFPVVTKNEQVTDIPTNLLKKGKDEEFAVAPMYDPGLIDEVCQHGFFPMSIDFGRQIRMFTPKCHVKRAITIFAPPKNTTELNDLETSVKDGTFRAQGGGTKNMAKKLLMLVNQDWTFDIVCRMIFEQHGEDWMCAPLRQCFYHMYRQPDDFRTKFHVFAVVRESETWQKNIRKEELLKSYQCPSGPDSEDDLALQRATERKAEAHQIAEHLKSEPWVGSKQLSKAIQLMTEALEIKPSSAMWWAFRADLHLQAKNFAFAILDATEALNRNQDSARAFKVRGLAHQGEKEFNLALNDLRASNNIDFFSDPELQAVLKDVETKAKKETETKKLKEASAKSYYGNEQYEIVSGELGYTVGTCYTSLTGAFTDEGAGSVQLSTMGLLLEQLGYKIWDLGMQMKYKEEHLHSKEITRDKWLETIKVAKGEKPTLLPLELLAKKEGENASRKLGAEGGSGSGSAGSFTSSEKVSFTTFNCGQLYYRGEEQKADEQSATAIKKAKKLEAQKAYRQAQKESGGSGGGGKTAEDAQRQSEKKSEKPKEGGEPVIVKPQAAHVVPVYSPFLRMLLSS